MKNFYFLSGLPRSGNTLLSALLNQNPNIYVSPLSPLLDNLTLIDKELNTNELSMVSDFQINTNNGLKNFVKGFYDHIQKPIIIDRSKSWGSKESIFTAYKYITNSPKIIYTVRDIPSILSSFLTLIIQDENNFIDNNLRQSQIKMYGNQTQNDIRCDWLMNNQIRYCLSTLTELLQTKVPICLIEYDNLITNPQNELNKIYDFLELDYYYHNFNNIVKLENETLENAGLPPNLHEVRSTIEKKSISAKSMLTELSYKKYSNLEFWRQI